MSEKNFEYSLLKKNNFVQLILFLLQENRIERFEFIDYISSRFTQYRSSTNMQEEIAPKNDRASIYLDGCIVASFSEYL